MAIFCLESSSRLSFVDKVVVVFILYTYTNIDYMRRDMFTHCYKAKHIDTFVCRHIHIHIFMYTTVTTFIHVYLYMYNIYM